MEGSKEGVVKIFRIQDNIKLPEEVLYTVSWAAQWLSG